MVRAPLTVEPDDTVEKLMIKVATNGRQRVFPVVLGDRVLGIVPLTWAAGVTTNGSGRSARDSFPWRRARAPAGRRAATRRRTSPSIRCTPASSWRNRPVGLLSLADVERVLPPLG